MKMLVTITGLNHYYGYAPFEVGQKLKLIKEPENEHDREAIRAEIKGIGKVGYVANSPFTLIGESMSAGRLYDKVGNTVKAKVKYILPGGIICKVCPIKNYDDFTIPSEHDAPAKDI